WALVRVLLDQVELGDELAEELARHHANIALEARRHLRDEPFHEGRADLLVQAAVVGGGEQLAQPERDGPQSLGVEGDELKLGLAQAGEAALLQEPDPLVERGKAGDPLPGVGLAGGAARSKICTSVT
ncbi:MAG TPA: hypothetical protein VNO25_03150, partial [Streptosporangiaceae bacterium]|nr:hypothetical protein [Streptosporangiaceae bacterium]